MIKKDNNFITFIKGFIIGLGIIFPISASVLAISMGIYKKLLKVINHLPKYLKNEPGFVISFILGIIISVIVSTLSLDILFKNIPIATLLFFTGLVLGGIPSIYQKIGHNKFKHNYLWTLLAFLIIFGLSLLKGSESVIITLDIKCLIILFIVGIIGSGSMLIPGVSGSIVLIMLGYYEPILDIIGKFFRLQDLMNNFIIIMVFGVGMLLGLVIFAKMINYFLEKYETKSYCVIIGFILASCLNIIISMFNYSFNIMEVLIGLILLILGFLISFKYLKEE